MIWETSSWFTPNIGYSCCELSVYSQGYVKSHQGLHSDMFNTLSSIGWKCWRFLYTFFHAEVLLVAQGVFRLKRIQKCQFISLMSFSGGLLFRYVQSLILSCTTCWSVLIDYSYLGGSCFMSWPDNCLWWLGFPVIFFSPSSQFIDTNLIGTNTAVEWLPVLLCSLDVLVLNLVWRILIGLKSLWCSSTWPAMPQQCPRLC